MKANPRAAVKSRLPLKDALFLGFCSAFILISRAAFRLKLKSPGHSMFFLTFFLLLARGCVAWPFAATCSGLISGAMAVALGMGKGGPLLLIKFVVPALVVDAGAWLMPGMFRSYVRCAIVAALAAMTRFPVNLLVDWLVGMDTAILVQHAAIQAGGAVLFGVAGSLFVPPVIRRLEAHGLLDG